MKIKGKKTRITKTEKIKQTSGITLIALVVTIVVLIILATVSISIVFSEDGIIKRAEQAKNMYANSLETEQDALDKLVEEYANIIGENGEVSYEESLAKGPNGKPLVTEVAITNHETIIGEDEKGNQVVIPGGFKIATDSGTTVQQGIVIEDENENQFVWIPVSNINGDETNPIILDDGSEAEITLGRYTFDGTYNSSTGLVEGTGEPTLVQSGSLWKETESSINETYKTNNSGSTTYYYELATTTSTTPAKDLEGFITSVETNKGYYLARYEASYASGTSVGEGDEYYKPASKISSIYSDSSMSYTEGTLWNWIIQGDASTVCKNMYYGDSYVESDLVNSYARDTAIVYIQAMGNSNYANANRDTTGNTTLLNTGTTGDEVCKIYDMAANVSEWTTEYCTDSVNPCTSRGGNCVYSGSYTASRNRGSTAHSNYPVGFRPLLYCSPVS